MKSSEVTVIDYGMGNLFSVRKALEHCGATVKFASHPQDIQDCSRLLLPGVGAFAHGMDELNKLQLTEAIRVWAAKGNPFLGICLGMQMLLDESEEFGTTQGLRLIQGSVIAIPLKDVNGHSQKIPHIGWNSLEKSQTDTHWEKTLFEGIKAGHSTYFVHSFMANPSNKDHRISDTFYGGHPIAAYIKRDNIHGCQFHPEKSAEVGLKVLENFLRL